MCGIAGIMMVDGSSPDTGLLDRLATHLAHRGPDGHGTHIAGNVGLVHTRLSIIDLKTGDQPIYDSVGRALIGNGEIYNYKELYQEFTDYNFTTASDCETALATFERDGIAMADALRGMYALAIHDPSQGRLLLSRDPFGIKPLYYIEDESFFAFASEPSALLKAGLVAPVACPNKRLELLQLQYTCGEQTIYSDVKRVRPGESIMIQGGRVVERRMKAALPTGGPVNISEQTAKIQLEAALLDSVRVHQRSDVPYGLFLSGGLDSATILAMMARLNDQPVTAFTAGFGGTTTHDEREQARKLARVMGADHHEVDFGRDDFFRLLPGIAAAMDDPAADYAILPTWKLAETAAQELKVVLCGEGGDELLAGYGRYRSLTRPWWLGGKVIRHRGKFDGLDLLREDNHHWRDAISTMEAVCQSDGRNRLQTAQEIDSTDWLANDLLTKLDRCLMAHGLEGRTPFLDPIVAKATFKLPNRLKIKKRMGKWILRQWLNENVPESQPFAKKRGFTVPVGEWMHSEADRLGALMARQPMLEPFCKMENIAPLFHSTGKRESFAAWTLLFYALWHKSNVDLIPNAKDATIFDMLEA